MQKHAESRAARCKTLCGARVKVASMLFISVEPNARIAHGHMPDLEHALLVQHPHTSNTRGCYRPDTFSFI